MPTPVNRSETRSRPGPDLVSSVCIYNMINFNSFWVYGSLMIKYSVKNLAYKRFLIKICLFVTDLP